MAKCTQCSQYRSDRYSDMSPPHASSHPFICYNCKAENKRETEIMATRKALERQVKALETRLQFLRHHQFQKEPTFGICTGDMQIIVQGATDQPLHAHKFILASRSSVFERMFETSMKETQSGVLCIDDATLPVVRAVLKFCYNAEIEFSDEVTSEAVLEVANKYRIDLLQRLCEEDLTATISEGNLPKRLKLARKFDSTGLEAAASQFFKDNFDAVINDVLSEFC